MLLKIIGILCVLACCSGFSFKMIADHRKEERYINMLICCMEYMESELRHKHTPLPELYYHTAQRTDGTFREVFSTISSMLNDRVLPDIFACTKKAISRYSGIPEFVLEKLLFLGECLGQFDHTGQMRGIESIIHECRCRLSDLNVYKEKKHHIYQTLGLCTGAAIVIILI